MTVPTKAMLYTQGYGSRPEGVEVPTYQTRNPLTTDVGHPLGKTWINTAANTVYVLTSFATSVGLITATWTKTSN